MKKANLILAAALAAAGVTGGTAALLVPATAFAQAQQKIGAKMMKPLKAAQEAIGQKNWEAALASLAEAQAIEPKSPYEAFMVDELGWYARLQSQEQSQEVA